MKCANGRHDRSDVCAQLVYGYLRGEEPREDWRPTNVDVCLTCVEKIPKEKHRTEATGLGMSTGHFFFLLSHPPDANVPPIYLDDATVNRFLPVAVRLLTQQDAGRLQRRSTQIGLLGRS